MKILLIEDDEILVAQLTNYLVSQNYIVESVSNGQLVSDYVQATNYDLVLLDLRLPGEDGISLCRQLRQGGYGGAILLQTVEADSDYKVAGLDAGADDYIVKPFSLEELSARIRALLRRPQGITDPILQWGKLQLDPSLCQVSYGDRPITLSPKEYNLLELFMRNPQRVFNNAMLLERIWGFDETPGEETVRTHIKRLRQKLKQAGADAVIENIYGMGYRLKAPKAQPQNAAIAPPPNAAQAARQFATKAISQFQDIIFARLAILDQAATAPILSDELRLQAQQAAHKLAGALGMFGLSDGSTYSRQVETSLHPTADQPDRQQMGTLVAQIHQVLEQVLPDTPTFDRDLAGLGPAPPEGQVSTSGDRPRPASQLLVVSTNRVWIGEVERLASASLEIVFRESIAQAQAQLSACSPKAILLDTATLEPQIATLVPLGQWVENHPNIPVLVITRSDSFEERLQISRYLTCTFLPCTLEIEQVLAIVQDTLQRRHLSTAHLLAVDDDPIVLQRLEQQLPRWGIHVTTLEDPRRLWKTLLDLSPDVLLLDVDMPHLDGIQLCHIIRSDSRWMELPILFLTACQETNTIQRIFAVGGDDYLPKPFTEPELVTRIFNRLERRQNPRGASSLGDRLPSLLAEHAALAALERDLVLAQQYQQPYCLGMITWGLTASVDGSAPSAHRHPVLHEVVHSIKANLRRADIVTQFHPGTITVGLYGVGEQAAHRRFQHLLQPLSQNSWGQNGAAIEFWYHLVTAPEDGTTVLTLRQTLMERLPVGFKEPW
ncbi:response regulator [Nodosilinea sp. LEGE 07088]|uniref:response regulator n=1 Tax=Nodosilinea sp. LEGE 07088 TaxID=2777968 RepID=UPI0018827E1D|nr:response regulator [Nodosilinea sp. LEGE 07088]MBE9138761.1 response regulator [Nodosilinea sp. LEGE 07088]